MTALLAASVALHLLHRPHVTPALVSAALMVILWCFRCEFYAAGDPRTRWQALRVLRPLLAADAGTGLAFIALSRVLAGHYGFGQRKPVIILGLPATSAPAPAALTPSIA